MPNLTISWSGGQGPFNVKMYNEAETLLSTSGSVNTSPYAFNVASAGTYKFKIESLAAENCETPTFVSKVFHFPEAISVGQSCGGGDLTVNAVVVNTATAGSNLQWRVSTSSNAADEGAAFTAWESAGTTKSWGPSVMNARKGQAIYVVTRFPSEMGGYCYTTSSAVTLNTCEIPCSTPTIVNIQVSC